MLMVDKLVDATSGHDLLSIMDGQVDGNQIFFAKEDMLETAFRCPKAIETYEWLVMPFS